MQQWDTKFVVQIVGKLVVAGQDKYMNNTSYLIKAKEP